MKTSRGYLKTNSPNKNSFIANYGSISGDAVRFIGDCKEFIELANLSVKAIDGGYSVSVNPYDSKTASPFLTRATSSDDMPKELGERIVCELAIAMQSQDGKFFRDIADVCERGQDYDDLRSWLQVVHFKAGSGLSSGVQDHTYSVKELVAMWDKREINWAKNLGTRPRKVPYGTIRKNIENACEELGIKRTRLRKRS